jgi:hypothetical protein
MDPIDEEVKAGRMTVNQARQMRVADTTGSPDGNGNIYGFYWTVPETTTFGPCAPFVDLVVVNEAIEPAEAMQMQRCTGCGEHFTAAALGEHVARCPKIKRLPK